MRFPAIEITEFAKSQRKLCYILLLVEVVLISTALIEVKLILPILAAALLFAILSYPVTGIIILILYMFLIQLITQNPGPIHFWNWIGLPVFFSEIIIALTFSAVITRRYLAYDNSKLLKLNIVDKYVIFYLLLGGWGILYGYLNGASLYDIIEIFRYYLRFPSAYFLARVIIKNEKDIRLVVQILFIAGFIMAMKWITIHGIRLVSGVGISIPLNYEHENLFYTFFAITGVYLFLSKLYIKKKYFPLFILSLMNTYTLLFSFRRAFWVSLVISIILMVILTWKQYRHRLKLLFVIIPILVIILMSSGAFEALYSRAATITPEYDPEDPVSDSNATRILENYNVFKAFLKKPLLGEGFGNEYEPEIPYPWPDYYLKMIHNCYGTAWIWMGIPGLITFTLIFLVFIIISYKLYRVSKSPFSRFFAMSSSALFSAFMIAASLAHYFYYIKPPIFIGIIGAIVSLAYYENKNIELYKPHCQKIPN